MQGFNRQHLGAMTFLLRAASGRTADATPYFLGNTVPGCIGKEK